VNDEVPVDEGRNELLWKCCGEGSVKLLSYSIKGNVKRNISPSS